MHMRTVLSRLAPIYAVLATFAAILAVILLAASFCSIATAYVQTIRNTEDSTAATPRQTEPAGEENTSLNPGTTANVGIAFILLASALAAAYRFHLFQESAQHITISHEVSTQRISPSYLLVNVNANLRNTSKVRVVPAYADCRVAQIAPLSDEQAESIYEEGIAKDADSDTQRFPWWELDRDEIRWSHGQLTVDPNESVTITFQLIVTNAVAGISATTGVYKRRGDDDGWFYQTTHAVPETTDES